MFTENDLYTEITKRFGTIKRARGTYLYTEKGVRLTDLYEEGGRAILGWGGGAAFTMFKNVLERGITGSFNTDFTPRVSKAVSSLLASERKVFCFTSEASSRTAATALGFQTVSLWRPWNQDGINWSNEDCVLLEPPLPWTKSVYLLCVSLEALKSDNLEVHEDIIPAPLAAAVTRAIYDMIKVLQEREEKNWFLYDTVLTKYWTRKGPYLYPKISEKDYESFVLHCLDCNLVISPYYEVPSIVPFGVDKGVFTLLKRGDYGAK